jgi:hypothetical protein
MSMRRRLREGLVGAWCPAITRASGLVLPDLSDARHSGRLANFTESAAYTALQGFASLQFVKASSTSVILPSSVADLKGDMSASWWFTAGVLTGNSANHVFGFYDGSSGFGGWALDMSGSPAITRGLGFWDGSAWRNTTTNIWQVGVFTHAAVSLTGGSLRVFMNGVLVDTVTGVLSTNRSHTGEKRLGSRAVSTSSHIDGILNDMRLWQRPISGEEAKALYEYGPGYGLRPEPKRVYFGGALAPPPTTFKPYWRQSPQLSTAGVIG